MEFQFKKLARREPRWLTSFADLMALLLALFVMLLSFAEVDSDSFKRNAGPISEAFFQASKPIQTTSPKNISNVFQLDKKDTTLSPEQVRLRLTVVLNKEIENNAVNILERDERIVIRFNDRAAFASGSRELTPAILPALAKVAQVLANTKGAIQVEGHTDDIPIATNVIRSNWDLSAARAASVVHRLLDQGRIKPSRISAMGLADSQPLVPNTSRENQAINRRVEITLDTYIPDSNALQSRTLRYQ